MSRSIGTRSQKSRAMKQSEIVESGVVTAEGKLMLPMDRLGDFFLDHAGERLLVKITAFATASERALGYYHGYVIPTIRQALWDKGNRLSEDGVEDFIRKQTCYWGRDEHGAPIPVDDMPAEDFYDYLEWLKEWAADELQVYVEDPRTI